MEKKTLFYLSLSTGFFSGVWIIIGIYFNIPTWIGFAGCTAFFAACSDGHKGVKKAIFPLLSGIFWTVLLLKLSNGSTSSIFIGTLGGIITFIMCFQGIFPLLAYIPATFIGSFSTFANNGNWREVLIGVLSGLILGYLSEFGGKALLNLTSKKNK